MSLIYYESLWIRGLLYPWWKHYGFPYLCNFVSLLSSKLCTVQSHVPFRSPCYFSGYGFYICCVILCNTHTYVCIRMYVCVFRCGTSISYMVEQFSTTVQLFCTSINGVSLPERLKVFHLYNVGWETLVLRCFHLEWLCLTFVFPRRWTFFTSQKIIRLQLYFCSMVDFNVFINSSH